MESASLLELSGIAYGARKTIKVIPYVLLSMFSSIRMAQIPYIGLLLAVLIGALCICHRLLHFKKSATKGYRYFLIRVGDYTLFLTGRLVAADIKTQPQLLNKLTNYKQL